MNGPNQPMQQPGRDPELTYKDPMAYVAFLRTRGLNPMQVDELVRQRFGPGKSPEQRAKEQAGAQQMGQLAQVGGAVGGALIAGEALQGFQNIGGLFTSATPTATAPAIQGAVTQPALLGGSQALGTTTGATTGSTLGSIGAVALPVAAGAAIINNAWETGMKDILRGRGDKADWTNQAVNMATGGIPNIALRLMGKRSIGAMMTSGKSNAQKLRDDFRGTLQQSGVADENYHVTLADGTKFNIGLDGKTKYKNVGENIDGKKTRNAWDVDFSNPLATFASSQIDPMIKNIYGPDAIKAGIKPEQYTGMLVNAVTSNAKSNEDVLNNIKTVLGKSTFAQQAGVGVTPPPPSKAPKGEVVRVSPGMYVNDQGHVGPAKTVRQSLRQNYNKTKGK